MASTSSLDRQTHPNLTATMSSPDDTNDTLSLVSSFYGPGNISCWLLTIAAVLVTWTLNPRSRQQDTITLDFMAALAIPSIAAGHLFYLVFSRQSHDELGEEAPSIDGANLFTSSSQTAIRYAAAVEAPLNVCETFSSVALTMFVIAAWNGGPRRAFAVVVAGLLAFSTEISLFIQTAGIEAATSNLGRPFLFNSLVTMVVILVMLTFFLAVLLIIGIMAVDFRLRRLVAISDATRTEMEQTLSLKIANAQRVERLTMWLAIIPSAVFAPSDLLVAILSATGWLEETTYIADEHGKTRLLFFIPRSMATITELDQAVSLAIGILTLCFSLWDALRVKWQADIEKRGLIDEDLASDQGLTVRSILMSSAAGRQLLERNMM